MFLKIFYILLHYHCFFLCFAIILQFILFYYFYIIYIIYFIIDNERVHNKKCVHKKNESKSWLNLVD